REHRQPPPVALSPPMFAFDLRPRAHRAGLLYSPSLDFGRIFLARRGVLGPAVGAVLQNTDEPPVSRHLTAVNSHRVDESGTPSWDANLQSPGIYFKGCVALSDLHDRP